MYRLFESQYFRIDILATSDEKSFDKLLVSATVVIVCQAK